MFLSIQYLIIIYLEKPLYYNGSINTYKTKGGMFMLYNIMGVLFILGGLWGSIFTIKNKTHMPRSVFALHNDKYKVVNKEKFNNLMIIQSFTVSMWFLLAGILCMFKKEPFAMLLPSFNVFINIIFSKRAKRYIAAR